MSDMPSLSSLTTFDEEKESASAWVIWNDPARWADFSVREGAYQQAETDALQTSRIGIDGMHCTACATGLEARLNKIKGIQSVSVSFSLGLAHIRWNPQQILPSVWLSEIDKSGYRPIPVLDDTAQQENQRETRRALWRWLVAGLCMMQVMMYAAPFYGDSVTSVDTASAHLLRWAQWVLTLPVVLFSSQLFFSGAYHGLRQRRLSMDVSVAAGILITFLVSTAATFSPQIQGEETYFDALTMFVFLLLSSRFLESRLREKTWGTLYKLTRQAPDAIEKKQADGSWSQVLARDLQPGDFVRVLPGQNVVADGVITEGQTQVSEALLTGESRPVSKAPGATLIAGSVNLSGSVIQRVDKLAQDTRLAQIVALMQQAALEKPRLVQLADKVAGPFLLGVFILAAAAGFHSAAVDPQHLAHAWILAATILIATCPCALSLATPSALLACAHAWGRHGVLTRHLQAIENLSQVDTFVFDKTGTLTTDELDVVAIQIPGDIPREMSLRLAYALAQHSQHPVCRSLVSYLTYLTQGKEKGLLKPLDLSDAALHPLWTQVEEKPGQGVQGLISVEAFRQWLTPPLFSASSQLKGMLDDLEGDIEIRLGSAAFCGVNAKEPLENQATTSLMQTHLAMGQFGALGAGALATFSFTETVRPGASQALAALQARGMQLYLCSGDQEDRVAHVAREVGISQFQAACTPEKKLAFLQELQQQGHRVVMVGDGMNDSPSLALASVSIAVGSHCALAQTHSDLVMLQPNLSLLPALLNHAQWGLRVIRQNLVWALMYNLISVPLAWIGYLPTWAAGLGMTLSSLLVVANAARLIRF